MKKIIMMLVIISLVNANEPQGIFKAKMGDKQYNVPVKCYNFTGDRFVAEFIFASDDGMAHKDTDGDGVVIRGDKVLISSLKQDGMMLTLIDKGVEYSSKFTEVMKQFNKIPKWSKTPNGVKGTTELVKDDEMQGTLMVYEVTCQ